MSHFLGRGEAPRPLSAPAAHGFLLLLLPGHAPLDGHDGHQLHLRHLGEAGAQNDRPAPSDVGALCGEQRGAAAAAAGLVPEAAAAPAAALGVWSSRPAASN